MTGNHGYGLESTPSDWLIIPADRKNKNGIFAFSESVAILICATVGFSFS